ncbi:MAG: hypothetical protein WD069_03950 [Planctomycetales bacterium]
MTDLTLLAAAIPLGLIAGALAGICYLEGKRWKFYSGFFGATITTVAVLALMNDQDQRRQFITRSDPDYRWVQKKAEFQRTLAHAAFAGVTGAIAGIFVVGAVRDIVKSTRER